MFIRDYTPSDCRETAALFYHTVHNVNAGDYSKEQLDVWADGNVDLDQWNQTLQAHYSVVAVEGEKIAGFGDIDNTGYLDRLYVHKDYQRKGIATALCNELESMAQKTIITHASITARPFFEKRGYKVLTEQQVKRKGIYLTNYICEKYVTNTPLLETERLLLRKFTKQDMAALFAIYSDEEVNRYLPWFPLKNMEEAADRKSVV